PDLLPENQETEGVPAEHQGRLMLETVAVWEIAAENELRDGSVQALVSFERFVQKRNVQEDRERADSRQDGRKTRAPEDRKHGDGPEDGRKTYALEACGSALHQT